MTKQFIYDFIAKNSYAVLSTVNADNKPEAALVGIAVTPKLEIIFDTDRSSRKYKNIMTNSQVALVIGWEQEKTLQYEGIARLVSKYELNDIHKTYAKVFPESISRKNDWRRISYFCVKPEWVRYSDYNEPQIIKEESF